MPKPKSVAADLDFDSYIQQGDSFFAQSDFTAAVDSYLQAIDLVPESAATYLKLGSTFIEQQQWQLANEYLQNALAYDVSLAKVHYYSGLVSKELGADSNAIDSFCRALKLDSSLQQCRQDLEILLFKQNFDWQFYCGYLAGEIIEPSPESAYQHWLDIGQQKKLCRHKSEFYQRFQTQIDSLPEDFKPEDYLYLNPDVANQYQGNKYRAIKHFLTHGVKDQREYSLDSARGHFLRGKRLAKLSQIDEAIAAYIQALKLDSTLQECRNNLEELLTEQGFDWHFYGEYYRAEIKDISVESAYQHWVTNGKAKNLYYSKSEFYQRMSSQYGELPCDFEPLSYLYLNPDVDYKYDGNQYHGIRHFLIYGTKEQREYSLTSARGHYLRGKRLTKLGKTEAALGAYFKSLELDSTFKQCRQELNSLLPVINTKSKPKVAVVSWDLSHNPAGRSFVLADMLNLDFEVELISPLFSFYGGEVWSPLKNLDLKIKTFKVDNLAEFAQKVQEFCQRHTYDYVYVSKPRFPSLFIGMLIKYYSQCPLVLDIDDYELSFFKNQAKASWQDLITAQDDPGWENLYSEIWTRFTEELISNADAVTVSNIALQHRYSGIIVRHGRNEKIFNPKLYSRSSIRQKFGYTDSDQVILFLGTPRPHKGIFRIADALEKIDNPNLKLCIVGKIRDKRVLNRFSTYQKAKIDFHDDQPWEDLPRLIPLADLICILQDENSPISDYQIPAKLTDAIAMNIPTIVTQVPPFLDLIATKSLIPIDQQDNSLELVLRKFITDKESLLARYASTRDTFLTEFSYQVNGVRIQQAFQRAKDNLQQLPELFFDVAQLITQKSGVNFFTDSQKKSRLVPKVRNITSKFQLDEPINILFFWKQNDSDLYGRRQDMIVKYLAQNDRINKIIHFDAPISVTKLHQTVEQGDKAKFSQNNLVFNNTVARYLQLKDTAKIIKRTFVYRHNNSSDQFLGRSLPTKDGYADFVRQVIQESNIGRNAIAWVCPVNFEFPLLHQELNFSFIVADLIDDQRKWNINPDYTAKLNNNYQQILQDAKVTFTNCQQVYESFREFNQQITVVPNGAELLDDKKIWAKPQELANLHGVIIGYVGNLGDRIDTELLKYVAAQNPDWNIVLIGSAHRNKEILKLSNTDNIYLLGVKPYNEALKFIKHFDVAIVPHVDNQLTRSMNPLKLYVYFAAGIPIVSTKIANIDEFGDRIRVAHNPAEFVHCIQESLEVFKESVDDIQRSLLLEKINWQSRAAKILGVLERQLEEHLILSEENQFTLIKRNIAPDKLKPNQNKALDKITKAQKSTKSSVLNIQDLHYEGICTLCGTQQIFVKNNRSLREGYQCNHCRASLRYRGQASAILKAVGKNKHRFLADFVKDKGFSQLSIYEPGVIGPFRKYFQSFNGYLNSYFWTDVPAGEYKDGLQCQNLEALSYKNDSFDLVISSDILEHVRHPWVAFKEIWRVLKPGGHHIFSIPVQIPMKSKTFERIDTSSSKDIHLVEPRYHSAPLPQGGRQKSLVYVDFGKDVVEHLQKIGFQVDLLSPSQQESSDIHRLITFISQKI